MQDRYADPVYQAYWRPDGDVTPIDAESGTSAAATAMDRTGVDKVVQTPDSAIYLAQRIRTLSKYNGQERPPDFSLRESTTDDPDEYGRLLSSWRSGGDHPSIYAFGIADATSKRDAVDRGLRGLMFIDVRDLLRAIATERLSADNIHDVEPGVRARYYTIQRLRTADVVRDEVWNPAIGTAWTDADLHRNFPSARDRDRDDGDASLFDF
jgi:hypothetical protein